MIKIFITQFLKLFTFLKYINKTYHKIIKIKYYIRKYQVLKNKIDRTRGKMMIFG